jgi:hypothetical protein
MLFKKSEVVKKSKAALVVIIFLMLVTGLFKTYHDVYEIKEYDRICPQNYGDKISLDRCYLAYKIEGDELNKALIVESVSVIFVPLFIYIISLI